LLADNNKWKQTLEDGRHMKTGHQLCQLFVTIDVYNQLSHPAELWELFKIHLCDAISHFLTQQHLGNISNEMVSDYGLYLEQCCLQQDDKTMESIGLPTPQHNWPMLLSATHSPLQMVFDCAEQRCF
jgi:hypothetical protein